MSDQTETMASNELKIKLDALYKSCSRVYGTCTDGSFELCLIQSGYYMIKKELDSEST